MPHDTIPGEDSDLRLHAALCAERHRALSAQIAASDTRMKRIEIAAYVILGVLGGGGLFTAKEVLPAVQAAAATAAAAADIPLPRIPAAIPPAAAVR